MKHLINSLLLIVASLTLANCKIKFSKDVTYVDGKGYYNGDTKSLRYFRGGWFGPADVANFAHDLTLVVENSGLITGNLKTPKCSITADVPAEDFAELNDKLSNARAEILDSSMIDGGDELMQRTTSDSKETHYLMSGDSSHGKPVIINEDAQEIKAMVKNIIAELEANNPCLEEEKAKISKIVISKSTTNRANMRATAQYRSELMIQVSENSASLTGHEKSSNLSSTCKRSTEKPLKFNMAYLKLSETIEFGSRDLVCMTTHYMNYERETITIYYQDGSIQSGDTDYCASAKYAKGAERFIAKARAVFNQVPKRCVY